MAVSDAEILKIISMDKKPATISKYNAVIKSLTASSPSVVEALRRPAATFPLLRKRYPKDKALENALSVIKVIGKIEAIKLSKHVKGAWERHALEVAQAVTVEEQNNVVSDKLRARWIEYGRIREECERIRSDGGGHETMRSSQAYVLLAFYAYLAPKRADLGAVKVVQELRTDSPLPSTGNAVVLSAKVGGAMLVLNEYKTRSVYGQFVEALPRELELVVRASLRAHPRTYLLCGPYDKPLSVPSLSTRVSTVMFHYLGVRLSINDLRHMYITQVVRLDRVTTQERMAIAKSMMHSPSVQLQYMRVL
jgi:hypothetical protein